jgi:hypothetical protein
MQRGQHGVRRRHDRRTPGTAGGHARTMQLQQAVQHRHRLLRGRHRQLTRAATEFHGASRRTCSARPQDSDNGGSVQMPPSGAMLCAPARRLRRRAARWEPGAAGVRALRRWTRPPAHSRTCGARQCDRDTVRCEDIFRLKLPMQEH